LREDLDLVEHHTWACSNLAEVRQRLGVLAEPTIS
jgi:hypothetical protein